MDTGERLTVLQEAEAAVMGPRQQFYGPPTENLPAVADAWTPYARLALATKGRLDGIDVCNMMILLKAMRGATGYHRDSEVDAAGYALLAEILNDDLRDDRAGRVDRTSIGHSGREKTSQALTEVHR